MFAPGQLVVFVGSASYRSVNNDTGEIGPLDGACPLRKGVVYTVAEVIPAGSIMGMVLTRVEVITLHEMGYETAFAAKLFRPISRTSTEIVEKLVEPVPDKAPVWESEPA